MPTLNWLNRNEAVTLASKAPYRLLEAVPELSYGNADTENMIIQGDNLDALKSLLPYYAGKVKCIYIDPPFNTKQAFTHYDDNLEHSIWLSLIYPRIEILKELLSEDGSFFVHIDDNQLGYLIVLMDEVLGRTNRVSIITFKQGAPTGHKAINPGLVTTNNYIVLYAKNKRQWTPNRLFTGRERDTRYNQFLVNPEDEYSQWRTIPLTRAFCDHMGKPVKTLKQQLGKEGYEDALSEFVIVNASRVIRPARPDYEGVGAYVRDAIDASSKDPNRVYYLNREDYSDMYFKGGERWLFYKYKLKEIDGQLVAGEPLTNLWGDLLSNNLHNEGGVTFPKGKKPEGLIKRVLEITTTKGEIVLDSFLGSGTTAAVAHKMGRQYIGIEMGDQAITHCVPRLKRVVDGEQGGISQAVNWQGGGGFRVYRLGETIFDEVGQINKNVSITTLASHIWFAETHTPLNQPPTSSLIGDYNGISYYLLYNGILSDEGAAGGNVLTSRVLRSLPRFDGPKVIYGEVRQLSAERLKRENITFKQIPYDIEKR
jgi:adenine-specific DNA-methyltransferase